MRIPWKMYLKVMLKLLDMGISAVQYFLGEDGYLAITALGPVQTLQVADHGFCILFDHDFRYGGIRVSPAYQKPGFSAEEQAVSRRQILQIPASLKSDGQRLGFHGIVFPQLGQQRAAQTCSHDGIQNAADLHLSCLGGS